MKSCANDIHGSHVHTYNNDNNYLKDRKIMHVKRKKKSVGTISNKIMAAAFER